MKISTLAILLIAALGENCFAGNINSSCSVNECPAGTHAKTYFKKSDPYYACETKEQAAYVNFAIGLGAMSIQLTGHPPNISPKTGEPEYLDGADGRPNETRLILDAMRNRAGVRTLDQAMAQCVLGSPNQNVVVMNNPKDGLQIWVATDKNKNTFWMPKSHLDKK